MNIHMLPVFLIGLVAIHAAPAPEDTNLLKDFEPVATQMRSLADATNTAVNDMSAEAKGASGRLLESAKELTAPISGIERANIPSNIAARLSSFQGNVRAEAKGLIERAMADTDKLQLNGRSALFGMGNAVQAMKDKYLTPDGQDLVKALINL